MFIGPCNIVIVEEWKTNLMLLAILFHFLCDQHVSDINISIIRSLRLCCWITTSVVLFSVRSVLEIWCGWFWVVFVLQAEAWYFNCEGEASTSVPPCYKVVGLPYDVRNYRPKHVAVNVMNKLIYIKLLCCINRTINKKHWVNKNYTRILERLRKGVWQKRIEKWRTES